MSLSEDIASQAWESLRRQERSLRDAQLAQELEQSNRLFQMIEANTRPEPVQPS
jgi:hypothetical protein